MISCVKILFSEFENGSKIGVSSKTSVFWQCTDSIGNVKTMEEESLFLPPCENKITVDVI